MRRVLVVLAFACSCTFEVEPIRECRSDAECVERICERLEGISVCVEPCNLFDRGSCRSFDSDKTCRPRSETDARGRCIDRGHAFYPDGAECHSGEECDDGETCVDERCTEMCDRAAPAWEGCDCVSVPDFPVGVCALPPEE